MSKFNSTKIGTKTTTYEGGVGYTKTPELELVQLLINSMLAGSKFYESEADTVKRLQELYTACNKKDITFFPKAAIYARDNFRLRSISHLCSAIVAKGIKDGVYTGYDRKDRRSFLRNYFKKVVLRADDITESISAYKNIAGIEGKIRLPHAMVRGFSDNQATWDEYTYAKYRQEDKDINMMDAVRMTHTKVTDKNKSALEKLVSGTLRNETTWEATVSKAGKAENKEEAKKNAWKAFLDKGERIEYFALLRNLNNIIAEKDKELISKAAELLCNEKLIKRSMVLPFRFLTAWKALSYDAPRAIQTALNKAADISLSNVPIFSGKTCVIIDESGSMECGRVTGNDSIHPFDIAMMYGASLFKSNDADVMLFSGSAWYEKWNPTDSVISLATKQEATGGWTRLGEAFKKLDKAYDRLIILSDMQTAGDANREFNAYRKKFNCDPYVYSFDLTGYKASIMPQGKLIQIGGFSEQAFDVMAKTEIDKNALINEVKAIEL